MFDDAWCVPEGTMSQFALFEPHETQMIIQPNDRTHQHDHDVGICVVPELPQPPLYILVGEVLGNVVHKEGSNSTTVVPESSTN